MIPSVVPWVWPFKDSFRWVGCFGRGREKGSFGGPGVLRVTIEGIQAGCFVQRFLWRSVEERGTV